MSSNAATIMLKTLLNHAKFEEAIDCRSFQRDQEFHLTSRMARESYKSKKGQKGNDVKKIVLIKWFALNQLNLVKCEAYESAKHLKGNASAIFACILRVEMSSQNM